MTDSDPVCSRQEYVDDMNNIKTHLQFDVQTWLFIYLNDMSQKSEKWSYKKQIGIHRLLEMKLEIKRPKEFLSDGYWHWRYPTVVGG